MFGLSARAVGYYAAFAYPFALLCAIPLSEQHVALDGSAERRRLRTAQLLTFLAPVHVVFPAAALAIARDAERLTSDPEANAPTRRRVVSTALVAAGVSIAAFLVLAGRF